VRSGGAPVCRVRVQREIGPSPEGRRAPVTPEDAAGRVVVPAVRAPVSAVRVPPAPVAVLVRLLVAAQPSPTAGPAPAPPTAAPAAVVPMRPARTVVPAAPSRPHPAGTRLRVGGRQRSGLRRRGTVFAISRSVDGIGRRLGVTAQLPRGVTVPRLAGRPKRNAAPSPDRSPARSVVQPRPVAAFGRGSPERRGRNRLPARGESSPDGAGHARGRQAPHVSLLVVARTQPATSGHRRRGQARAPPANPSAAAVVSQKPPAGAALRRSDASLAATRSRAARRSGSCLRRTAGQCTRSG